MTQDDLDLVVMTTKHARFRHLTDPSHSAYNPAYLAVVTESAAKIRAEQWYKIKPYRPPVIAQPESDPTITANIKVDFLSGHLSRACLLVTSPACGCAGMKGCSRFKRDMSHRECMECRKPYAESILAAHPGKSLPEVIEAIGLTGSAAPGQTV